MMYDVIEKKYTHCNKNHVPCGSGYCPNSKNIPLTSGIELTTFNQTFSEKDNIHIHTSEKGKIIFVKL